MKTPPTPENALLSEIFQRIDASAAGAISFAEYMELALYHSDYGYYQDPQSKKIGRKGDFFTSVSVGDCFGFLLGEEIVRRWREEMNFGENITVVEQGAHDGQLAIDILDGLARRHSELAGRVRYVIIEPSIRRRSQLSGLVAAQASSSPIEIVSRADEIRDPQGIFFCNELLDAFPVHLVRFEGGGWKEQWVARGDEMLEWEIRSLEADSDLQQECTRIGTNFPEGYSTEICLGVRDWIRTTASIFERGYWWMIDYGFEEDDYYAPHRTSGTLQCYRDHRVIENPFEFPGQTDITAHVNFSQLFRNAEAAGLVKSSFSDQHDFLTRAATPWLTGMESAGTTQEPENRKRLRQFQTLTHPGMMGRVFKVAEFSRGL